MSKLDKNNPLAYLPKNVVVQIRAVAESLTVLYNPLKDNKGFDGTDSKQAVSLNNKIFRLLNSLKRLETSYASFVTASKQKAQPKQPDLDLPSLLIDPKDIELLKAQFFYDNLDECAKLRYIWAKTLLQTQDETWQAKTKSPIFYEVQNAHSILHSHYVKFLWYLDQLVRISLTAITKLGYFQEHSHDFNYVQYVFSSTETTANLSHYVEQLSVVERIKLSQKFPNFEQFGGNGVVELLYSRLGKKENLDPMAYGFCGFGLLDEQVQTALRLAILQHNRTLAEIVEPLNRFVKERNLLLRNRFLANLSLSVND